MTDRLTKYHDAKPPDYECGNCCEPFVDETGDHRCPYCGSHKVFEVTFEALVDWMITRDNGNREFWEITEGTIEIMAEMEDARKYGS